MDTTLAISYVGSVSAALVLPFSQTSGFFAGVTATVTQPNGGLAAPGRGGLEFSNAVLQASGIPLGTNTAPPNVWRGVAWGCGVNCANFGAIGNGINFPDAFANPSRSALEVTGKFGTMTDVGWTDVTTVRHHNIPIAGFSNVLRTVDIHSILRLGADGTIVDTPSPTITKITFTETLNNGACTVVPVAGAPVNPLKSKCDDFVIVSGLDLASIFLPAGAVGNPLAMFIDFRLSATANDGAIVCDGSTGQPAACLGYAGPDTIVYTAEGRDNSLTVQAQLRPATVDPVALFVIGDVEPHAIGDVVNFWGAQWWKNNFMSGFVSKGVASFKGYANKAEDFCGGRWESRPGNSSGPPATIPDEVAIIVTDTVLKVGPNISGTIKQILLVRHDGAYGPNPGHRGSGPVTKIICTKP